MILVLKGPMPGGHCGLSEDPLQEMGIAVAFQPSDERGLAPRVPELVNCVTVGVPDNGEDIVVPGPRVIDDEGVGEPEPDPPAIEELPDIGDAEFELGPVIKDDGVSLERKELRVDEKLDVPVVVLDDKVLDVRLSDDVVLTKTGDVGIVGELGLVIVVLERGTEVLESGIDDCVDMTDNEDEMDDVTVVGLMMEVVRVDNRFV